MEWIERVQILTAAIGPTFVLGWLVFVLGHRTLPPDLRSLGLVAGAFSAMTALAASAALALFVRPAPFEGALEAYVHAALIEETAKFGFLILMVLRHFEAETRRDAIFAGIWIGLGFGALENVAYVISAHSWQAISIARATSAVPFHATLGAIMGCLVQRSGGRPGWWPVAVAIPVLLHGSYNWGAFVIDDPFEIAGLTAEGGFVLFSVTLAISSLFLIGPVAVALRTLNRGKPTPPYTPLPDWVVPLTSVGAIVLVLAGIASVAIGVAGWRPLWKHASLMIPAGVMPIAFAILWWRAHPHYVPATLPPGIATTPRAGAPPR